MPTDTDLKMREELENILREIVYGIEGGGPAYEVFFMLKRIKRALKSLKENPSMNANTPAQHTWFIRPGTQTQIAYQVPQEDPTAPRPYKTIAETDTPERAAFIVRAVNVHEELSRAAKLAHEYIGKCVENKQGGNVGMIVAFNVLEAAITKAEGR